MPQLFEVALFAEYFNQQVVNRWNYYAAEAIANAQGSAVLLQSLGFNFSDFLDAPDTTVAFDLSRMQHITLIYTSCTIRAIYDVNDFVEIGYPSSNNGIFGDGLGAEPFTAIGFRTNRIRQDIGRGYKRFGGIPADLIGSGGVINGGGLLLAGLLATTMSQPLITTVDSQPVTFRPCVVKKQKASDVVDPDFSGSRYYPTLAEQEANLALGITWTPYGQARSQTSRQYGSGG